MIASPHVETATTADLAALMRLREALGWHKNETLLRAVLDWERGRVFVVRAPANAADEAGEPVASTSAIAVGSVGVIGNVIVLAAQQRRGLGRAVMRSALDWLRHQGVRSVLLAATPEGRPLYGQLGFVGTTTSWFCHAPLAALAAAPLQAHGDGLRVHVGDATDLSRLATLDAAVFGADRLALLALLLRSPKTWLLIAEDVAGAQQGYLLLHQIVLETGISLGMRVGPWVARSPEAAAALLGEALRPGSPWHRDTRAADHGADADALTAHLMCSLPDTNPDALTILAQAGAAVQEDDLVMQLDYGEDGQPTTSGTPRLPVVEQPGWLYAWAAPMVF